MKRTTHTAALEAAGGARARVATLIAPGALAAPGEPKGNASRLGIELAAISPSGSSDDLPDGAPMFVADVKSIANSLGLPPGAATRWGLPLVAGIGAGHDRFNALSRLLAPATPRALSQGLTALGKHGLVSRAILDTRPPASRYDLTRSGRLLATACR